VENEVSRRVGELDARKGMEKPKAAEVRRRERWRIEKGEGSRAVAVVVEREEEGRMVVWRVRRRRKGRRSMAEMAEAQVGYGMTGEAFGYPSTTPNCFYCTCICESEAWWSLLMSCCLRSSGFSPHVNISVQVKTES
jgi:hypothetical protein